MRLLAALAISLVLLLWPAKPPTQGWWPLWWNWMHVPLFGWLAWEAMRFLRACGWQGWRAAFALFTGAAILAIGAEYLQHSFGRQADWEDVARSMAGAVGTFALLEAVRSSGLRKVCLCLLSLLCFVGSANALLQHAALMHQKSSAFPLLEDFESASSLPLWSLEHDGVPQPRSRKQENGRWHLEMPIAKVGFSSLRHDAQSRDWSPYRTLVLHYRLEDMPTLHLGVRLDGGTGGKERLNLETYLQAGSHVATISLPGRQEERPSLLSSIRTLTLFSSGGAGGMLAIEELRLE
jgi:VanZ family protein